MDTPISKTKQGAFHNDTKKLEKVLFKLRSTMQLEQAFERLLIAVIDTEYTGESVVKNYAPNIAVVIADVYSGEILEELNLNIRPFRDSEWSKERVENFWVKFESPKQYMEDMKHKIPGQSIKKSMDELVTFLKKWDDACGNRLLLACDHPESDVVWISFYLNMAEYPTLDLLFGSFRPILSIYWYTVGLSLTTLEKWTRVKDSIGRFNSLESFYLRYGIPWRNHGTKSHMALADAKRVSANICEIDTLLRTNEYYGRCYWFQVASSLLMKTFISTNCSDSQTDDNKLD